VDLSHVIEHGMATYPGLPGPEIGAHLSFEDSTATYAPGTEFTIGRITMVSNTGTYLDTPAHRYRDGFDLSGLPLERCVDLPALVVDGPTAGAQGFGPDAFDGLDLSGRAVLLRTGWSRHWRAPEYGDLAHPFLTTAGARLLVEAGVALVGIDSVNIDDTRGGDRPAHSQLLAAGIPVVEHLTALERLPASGARFTAVPPGVRGMGTFPVRAFARLP